MDNTPLVSVIIPCYNAEKYVEQAVCSIMNQTYKNLEILIIDDCSTDHSFEILQRLASEDYRITLVKNDKNLKIVKTLNKLVCKARGKYIARMDADDISALNRLEKQVDFMENNPEYGICGTKAWRIDSQNMIIGRSLLPQGNEEIQIASKFFCIFYHPSVIIRSEIFKQNLYNENYLYAEDLELWQRLLQITKAYNLNDNLLFYRLLKTSASNNSTSGSIQKLRTNELCAESNFNLLKNINNKTFVGMIIWNKLRTNIQIRKQLKFWMKIAITKYILYRIYEKIFYKIKKTSVIVKEK